MKRVSRSERRKQYLKVMPPHDAFKMPYWKASEGSDIEYVVISGASIDYAFEEVFRLWLTDCDSTSQLFEWAGPLGSHGARLRIANAFSLLSKDFYDDMSTLNEIRNCFAHGLASLDSTDPLSSVSFSSSEIKKLCSQLKSPELHSSEKPDDARARYGMAMYTVMLALHTEYARLYNTSAESRKIVPSVLLGYLDLNSVVEGTELPADTECN